jgi:hypothetical protein
MSAAPAQLAALRHLLAERFPSAPRTAGRVLATGLATLDAATGGLPLSAISEVVCAAPSCGGHLLLAQLLAITRTARTRVALIDGHDEFDPASLPPDLLAHLVWVRCAGAAEALAAADLLARDANFALVVLDLRRASAGELRRIPAPTWYRLQRAVEGADLALLVATPRPVVPSAQLRLLLATSLPAAALDAERPALVATFAPAVQRQRLTTLAAAG